MKRLVLAFSLLSMSIGAEAAPDRQAIALKVMEDFILPAYETFANRSQEQAELWQTSCNAAKLKPSYKKTADAWAKVQHIKFGPLSLAQRHERLYSWPDPGKKVAQHLNAALEKKDLALLVPKTFASVPPALQGLPALERVLYSDALNDDYGCELGKAISTHIALISRQISDEWKDLRTAQLETGNTDTANKLFSELTTGFQLIGDQKINLARANSLEEAQPMNAEGWRSKRSTRYIQQNALGLMAMAQPFMSFLPEDEAKKIIIQFSLFARAANNLPLSVKEAVSDIDDRARLGTFLKANQEMQNLLIEVFNKNMNFNQPNSR